MNVTAAAWTRISGLFAEAVELIDLPAFLALDHIAKAALPQALQTGITGRELPEELDHGECHEFASWYSTMGL